MSRWKTYQHLAVDPAAFCAFGVHKRIQSPPFDARFELWGAVRGGGGRVVLSVYDEMGPAKVMLDKLVQAATEDT